MATIVPEGAHDARTLRKDAWWVQPLLTVLVLCGFIVYATYRTFENANYLSELSLKPLWDSGGVGHLLSPFYSPLISVDWVILGYHFSPALLILPFPLSFRLTCYYYRKAYYRSFTLSPPACAVEGLSGKKYTGEKFWPMAFQNLHRFAFYAAFIFIFILGWDVIKSMQYSNGWGISVGTFVLLFNVIFLGCYTFGCHSWRHLIGGKVNCYSCSAASRTQYGLWKKATFLNERHALFAWVSLFGVMLTDVYIRAVCTGAIVDQVLVRF